MDFAVPLYLTLRQMSTGAPCRIHREHDSALFTIDPRTTRVAALQFVVDNLRPDERAQLRAAFGICPNAMRSPDWTTSDEPLLLFVPAPLRLAGAAALQGGPELQRRKAAGLLVNERTCYQQELARQPFRMPQPVLA